MNHNVSLFYKVKKEHDLLEQNVKIKYNFEFLYFFFDIKIFYFKIEMHNVYSDILCTLRDANNEVNAKYIYDA